MDASEIQSDLDSLKRLYGLVQTESSDTQTHAALDGRARLVLKNLLDDATERALKIVSDQGEAQKTGSTAVKQPAELCEEQSIPLQHSSINAELDQNVQKQLVGYNKDIKPDGSSIPLLKENSFTAEQRQAGMIKQPVQNVQGSELEYRTKRCRVCQRNTIKQIQTKDGMRLYHSNTFSGHHVWNSDLNTGSSQQINESDDSKSQRRNGPFDRNLSFTERRGFHLDRVTTDFSEPHSSKNEVVRRQQDADFLSKEASKAIEQIESGISAFHLGDNVQKTKSMEQAAQTEYSAVPSLYMNERKERYICIDNGQYGFSSVGQELPPVAAEELYPLYLPSNQTSNLVQPTRSMWEQSMGNCITGSTPRRGSAALSEMVELPNNIQGQNVKAIIGKFESGNWMMGSNELVPSQIHGVRNVAIHVNPNETFYASGTYPATYPSTSGMRNPCHRGGIWDDDTPGCRLFQTYIPTDTVMSLNESENIQFVEPNQTFRTCPPKIIFADHFDKKPSQPSAFPGFHQSRRTRGTPYNKDGILQNRNYIDDTSDSYTSNSKSEPTSESEEYSSPDNSGGAEYAVSRTSGETTGSFYSEDPSYYSSTSGAALDESSRSSSMSEESSSRDRAMNYRIRAKSGLSRTVKSSNCKNLSWPFVDVA